MNKFDIVEKPGRGRCMIAKNDIADGETILEEEPFVSCQFSWNKTYGYLACDHCMRPLENITSNVQRLANQPLLVVPYTELDPTLQWEKQFTNCQSCKVRYCSEDCRLEALNRYHKAECLGHCRQDETHPINMLNELWKTMHYPPETGTIMLLVRLMALYKQSNNKDKFLEDLLCFQANVTNREQTICHKMLGENFQTQMEQLYAAFCNAFQSEEFSRFTSIEAFLNLMALMGINCQGIATSVLAEWVQKVTALNLPEPLRTKLDDTINDIYTEIDGFAGGFLNNEGVGLYVYQSKINHSCAPNAESTFPYSNDIVVIKALRPIKAGQEICISYIDECDQMRSRHTRQKILKENYIFLCECEKCQEQAKDPDVTSDEEFEDDEMEIEDDLEEMQA